MSTTELAWPDNNYSDWIGYKHQGSDVVSTGLVGRFGATLPKITGSKSVEGSLPYGLQWCLAPVTEPRDTLGGDGHPKLGFHLPPIALSRRMWAGSSLVYHNEIHCGDKIDRTSTIVSIELKQGRSGPLAFVRIQHDFTTPRGPFVTEIQNLVFRNADDVRKKNDQPGTKAVPFDVEHTMTVETDPVLLFRYSALTFNGHRIHYDQPYATRVEGYPGLIVHGPLIATLLANFAASELGPLERFEFRALSPVFVGDTLSLSMQKTPQGMQLAACDGSGTLAMTAQAAGR
jgi:3-methylfumaryl-CoA hydratase